MNEDRMTTEEFLANRKAAGRLIDVETCDVWWEHCKIVDPYGVDRNSEDCIGRIYFVASLDSDGKVCVDDLPDDKYHSLRTRLDRVEQTPTTAEGVRDVLLEEYNRAVAALDNAIYYLVDVEDVGGRFPSVPFDVIRHGARLALAKLGKEGTPLHGALERKFRRLERLRAKSPMEDCVPGSP